MGAALFERRHRRLLLNEAGRAFLDAVRDAMRRIDDGWDRVSAVGMRGPVRIGIAAGAATIPMVRALTALARRIRSSCRRCTPSSPRR